MQENEVPIKTSYTPSFINAFQLIAMSQDLDLSGLFEVQVSRKYRSPSSLVIKCYSSSILKKAVNFLMQCRIMKSKKQLLDPSIQSMKP